MCTYYVPDNYAKMQWEVDNAYAGDTIIVRDGYENVVNKDHLTIKSESGAERTIVKAANSGEPVFEVTEDYVEMSGFTVEAGVIKLLGMHLKNNEIEKEK